MPRSRIAVAIVVVGAALFAVAAPAQQAAPDAVRIATGQNATIGLIAGGPGSTDARVAADIAEVLDDG
jgi:TRAP-type uncharacterized transport system substrate-binding protein